MFKKFKEKPLEAKMHFIGSIILLSVLILCNLGRYFYVKEKTESISNYQAISSEDFDIETNAENILVYGKITCDKPVEYKDTEYAMVRNITIKYSRLDDPHIFKAEDGTLYEKEILENRNNLNLFYTTDFAKGIRLGNMEITENMITSVSPYVIDYNWNNDSYEQTFVSVVDLNQNNVFYIESVDHGFASGVEIFSDIQTAREALIPSFWGFLALSIVIFFAAYAFLWIFIALII